MDRAAFNQGENAQYDPFVGESDTMPSIVARGPHAVAHTLRAEGFDASEDGTGRGTPIVTTAVCAKWAKGTSGPAGDEVANIVAFDPVSPTGHQGDTFVPVHGPAHCLPAGGGNNGGGGQVLGQSIPRRLTPRETERLQGFPDGWTAWGTREDGTRRDMADGPRYRMMGNAVTVNVVEWIAQNLGGQ